VKGLNEQVIVVNANQGWEKFIVEWKSNNKIALRQQASNLYLGRSDNTEDGLGLVQVCNTNEIF